MRVAASIAVTVLATTVLAGCQFVTPQQTARSYTPSDGVNGAAGDVEIRNVFVIDGTGGTASVIGVLSNRGSSDAAVTLSWSGSSGTRTRSVPVPAGGLVSMTTDPTSVDTSVPGTSRAVVLEGVHPTPGGLFNVKFSTSGGERTLGLPVLTGSFSQYATLVPTFTPTPTPTPTPTGTATGIPASGVAPTPSPTSTLAG